MIGTRLKQLFLLFVVLSNVNHAIADNKEHASVTPMSNLVSKVNIGGTNYDIPFDYMINPLSGIPRERFKPKDHRVTVDYVTIYARVTNLLPHEQVSREDMQKNGIGDVVDISISQNKGNTNWYSAYKEYIEGAAKKGDFKINDKSKRKDLIEIKEGGGYKYLPKNKARVVIFCVLGSKPEPTSCSVRSDAENNKELDYFYSYKHIDDWERIDRAVKAIVNGFVVKQ